MVGKSLSNLVCCTDGETETEENWKFGRGHSESGGDMDSWLKPLAMEQDRMGFATWLLDSGQVT